jgi:hypothetical protein
MTTAAAARPAQHTVPEREDPHAQVAVCIGCGCDDNHACPTVHGFGCRWRLVNRLRRIGICSECVDIHAAPNVDVLTPDPGFTQRRFSDMLEHVYGAGWAYAWFNTTQSAFGQRKPCDLVAAGEIRRVRIVVDELLEGADA